MRVVRAVHDSVRRPHGRAWLYDLSRDQANALIASTASMPARRTSYPNKNFRRPGEFEILLTLSNSGNIHSVLAGLFTHCCVAFRLTYLQYACASASCTAQISCAFPLRQLPSLLINQN